MREGRWVNVPGEKRQYEESRITKNVQEVLNILFETFRAQTNHTALVLFMEAFKSWSGGKLEKIPR